MVRRPVRAIGGPVSEEGREIAAVEGIGVGVTVGVARPVASLISTEKEGWVYQ